MMEIMPTRPSQITAALVGLVVLSQVGCQSRPEETIQLVRVSSSLLSSSSPPGHQLRSVAVDPSERIWVGSRDAGLSLLMPQRGRFLLLTPDIERFGTDVTDIQIDPQSGDLILTLGDRGEGRLVRYDPRKRVAMLIERPSAPDPSSGPGALDLRDPNRGWVQSALVLPDGTVWASTREAPGGLHAALGELTHQFIEDGVQPTPRVLTDDGEGGVWALADHRAMRYDPKLRLVTDVVDLMQPVLDLKGFNRELDSPAFHAIQGVAAAGEQLWVAADDTLWYRRGGRLERFRLMDRVAHPGHVGVMRSGERIWVQLEGRFLSLNLSDPSQVQSAEFLVSQEVSRLLGGANGSMWVGSQQGMFGFDTGLSNERPYLQYTVLPSPDGPEGSSDVMLLPQQLLNTRAGLLLATWGSAPARYDEEAGIWLPMSLDARPGDDEVVTTAVSAQGAPVLLTRGGIRRWDARTQQFGAEVSFAGFLRDGERLDVALDQFDGVIALACPSTDLWAEVEACRKAAYLPPLSLRPLPLGQADNECIKPLKTGLSGWLTSDRQAVTFCAPDVTMVELAPEAIQGFKMGLEKALKRFMGSNVTEFEPLAPVSSSLQVGWVVTGGQLGVWKLNGSVEPVAIKDRDLLVAATSPKRDHRRFVMDSAGNLCHLRPTIGQSRAEVTCVNTLGSQVFSWLDEEGQLGSLRHARLRVADNGRLWIDGLRGQVAWLEQDGRVHVVRFELDERDALASERPRSRILGFDRDHRAWVAARDVWRVSARLDGAKRPLAPEVMSSRRLWDRERWPMAPLASAESASQFVLAGPDELLVASLGSSGRARSSVMFRRMFGDERSPVGSEVAFMETGSEPGELWVGLRDGGVLHYTGGQARKRYARRAGLAQPEVLALASARWGAVVSTPGGLHWLDPESGRARRIEAPQLANALVVELATLPLPDGGEVVFAITDAGAVWRLTIPVEPPRAEGQEDAADVPGRPRLKSYAPLTPDTLLKVAQLEGARPTVAVAFAAEQSLSGEDELLVGTTGGLWSMRRAVADSPGRLRRLQRGNQGPFRGAVTALTKLPDGRVAAAWWLGESSRVSLHDTSSDEWWAVVHPDRQERVHALAPLTTPLGEVFLVARQRETLAMTSVPLVIPAEVPRWVWAALLGLVGSVLVLWVFLGGQSPVVARFQSDPESLREQDLASLFGVDRLMGRHREALLAAAGIPPARWEQATRLSQAWYAEEGAKGWGASWESAEAPDRIREACEVLGVEQLEEVHADGFMHVCRVRLPRLPINLPAQETAVVLLQARGFDPAWTQADPRFIEDALGKVLREMGQSMGTPFLLMTDLDEEPLPTLVQARFPGVIFRGERLRGLLFAEVPRQKLAQAILMDAWLDAISPYKSSGPVDDPAMFMGRERVRRELISARSVSAIVCGGRRVGKTSLIRQLVRDLHRERPDMKVYEVSLLGIRSYSDFVERLERRLDVQPSRDPQESQDEADASDEEAGGGERRERSGVLERLRRRRAKRRVARSMTPEVAAVAVREALEARFAESGQQPLLIMDEIDGIAARDAEAGYPLLSMLHQLKAEGICSFVLVGFAELYRQTHDYDSPLYNFARVLQLRGLDDAAALRLVTEPMARLGVTLVDPWIAEEIVAQTAGLPNLVQFICDMLLRGLSERRETRITREALEAILNFEDPASQPLSAYLTESFDQNVTRREELLVYTMLLYGPRPSSLSDIDANLERLGITTSLAERRAMVRRMKLVGVLKELPGEEYDLALPVLVRLLLSKDLKAAIDALEEELRGRDEDATT